MPNRESLILATRPTSAGNRPRWWIALMLAGAMAVYPGCGSAPPSDDYQPDEQDTVAREIEEADIIKLLDGFFYIANPYTGLRIIDVQDINSPQLMGRVMLGGRTVELFARQNLVFVFTTADFFICAGTPVGFGGAMAQAAAQPDFRGSRLWIVDVTDKSAPNLIKTLDFDGFVTATRRVGDVIYAAGNLTTGSQSPATAPSDQPLISRSGVFVTSITIANPQDVRVVQTLQFTGSSLDIHVSDTAMYVVGDDPQISETTLATYIDISDPAGAIVQRDQFRVPGRVSNRFFVDDYQNTFRIVTDEFDMESWRRVVALYTYDVSNPDDIQRLARLPIVTGESLRAVRFDRTRGYAVTFEQIDPLFVLDLSDPLNPSVSGELEVPGFSTYLFPRGDRLIGVGIDDTRGTRPAVSLYDVSNPAQPRQLSRIIVGDRYTTASSEATVDEKALRIVEQAGLILLPFSTFDEQAGRYVDRLQIIGLEPSRLHERGEVTHRGLVRRADLLDTRIWILSDLAFQSVNVDNLDAPRSLAQLDLMSDQELLDAGLSACAQSARSRGTRLSQSAGNPFNDIFWPFRLCGELGLAIIFFMTAGLLMMKLRYR